MLAVWNLNDTKFALYFWVVDKFSSCIILIIGNETSPNGPNPMHYESLDYIWSG